MKTIPEVNKAIIGQLEAALGKALPIFPKAFLRVLSKMMAGVFILIDRYIGFTLFQLFVTSATWEEVDVDGKPVRPLVLWGDILGVDPPVLGVKAALTATVTVSAGGATAPKGTQLLHRATGNVYLCTAGTSLSTPTTDIPIESTSAGIEYNLNNGSILEFVITPSGAEKRTAVASTVTLGVDGETQKEYRVRVLSRSKSIPEGGAPGHYRKWVVEAGEKDITKAYPYRGPLPSSVELFIDTGDGTTPSAPQIATVQAYAEALAPAGDKIDTKAVTRTAFVVTVYSLFASSTANQPKAESDVETAIENYFASREPFIPKVSILPSKEVVSSGEVYGLSAKAAYGVNASLTAVVVTESATPVTNYTLGSGERASVTVVFA